MIGKNFSKIMNKEDIERSLDFGPMTKEAVERSLKDLDAKLYNLMSAYLNDCMEPDAVKKFENWFTRRKLDTFNKTAKEKKEFYEG
mgnify:CR=1 FL=1